MKFWIFNFFWSNRKTWLRIFNKNERWGFKKKYFYWRNEDRDNQKILIEQSKGNIFNSTNKNEI